MLEASNTPAGAQSRAISPNPPADYPPGEDTQPTSPDVEELDEQLRALMARGFRKKQRSLCLQEETKRPQEI